MIAPAGQVAGRRMLRVHFATFRRKLPSGYLNRGRPNWFGLWGAVRGYQPGFPNGDFAARLVAGNAQAGGFEIRPGLLRAVAAGRVNVEPVALGEDVRHAGLDLGGEAGENGERCGNESSDSDC
jgi:hypothetical protein